MNNLKHYYIVQQFLLGLRMHYLIILCYLAQAEVKKMSLRSLSLTLAIAGSDPGEYSVAVERQLV